MNMFYYSTDYHIPPKDLSISLSKKNPLTFPKHLAIVMAMLIQLHAVNSIGHNLSPGFISSACVCLEVQRERAIFYHCLIMSLLKAVIFTTVIQAKITMDLYRKWNL